MIQSAEARLDGTALVVRNPMRFQRRDRKRIVPHDGSEIVPTSNPKPDGALVKTLARAWRWQRLLDDVQRPPLGWLLSPWKRIRAD